MLEFLREMISNYPFGSFLVIMATLSAISYILHAVLFNLPARMIRHLNIRHAGWPPPHVDADGDFNSCEEDEDEESEED